MICKEQEASIWIGTAEKSVKVAEKISLLPYTTEEAGGFVVLYGRYVCILKWQQ